MERHYLTKLSFHHLAPYFLLKPSSLFLSPTLRCNSRCSHCDVWQKKENSITELSTEQWQKILSNRFFENITALWISGGEPTLRKDISEIAIYSINILPRIESITLATNALTPLTIRNFLEKILPIAHNKKKYIHLHISLDGPPEVHNAIRGVEEAFSSLQQTIDIIRKLKVKYPLLGFSFNCVIQQKNLPFLKETYDIALNFGATITFNVKETRKSFYRRDNAEQIFNRDEKEKIIYFLRAILKDSDVFYQRHYETIISILEGKKRTSRCETLEATFYIDPDGVVYSCPVAYRNTNINLLAVSPQKAWKKLFELKKEIRKKYCPTCFLGCSFGEGLSILEMFKQYFKGG